MIFLSHNCNIAASFKAHKLNEKLIYMYLTIFFLFMSVRVQSHDHQHAPNKLKRSNYIDTSIYVSYNEIFGVLSVERGGKQKISYCYGNVKLL